MLMRALTGSVYRRVAKPFFFQFDPELVHNTMVGAGKALGTNLVGKSLVATLCRYQHPNLQRKVDGITFPNQVGLSAGFDYNGELTSILPSVGFGFHTIGTVTYRPYEGNPKPRLGRLPKSRALIVNKGLKNRGAFRIIASLEKKQFAIPTSISIASTNTFFPDTKTQILDMAKCFQAFEHSTVQHHYYELNISCPNTFGGEPFTTPDRLGILLKVLDKLHLSRPVYIKMPVDLSEVEMMQLLKVADKHDVAGVIIGNLTKDHNNPDLDESERRVWAARKGNLGGKPTWHRSNNLIAFTKRMYKDRFTIIGTGGVFSGADAAYKLSLGANLVQLITGMIYQGPQLIGDINEHLVKLKLES